MRKIMIILVVLGLFLSSIPVPGHCYTNVVAQKTNDKTSNHGSSLQTGMSPGIGAAMAIIVAAGTGILARIAAYDTGICTHTVWVVSKTRYIINTDAVGFKWIDIAIENLKNGSPMIIDGREQFFQEVVWSMKTESGLKIYCCYMEGSEVKTVQLDTLPDTYERFATIVRSQYGERVVSVAAVFAVAAIIYLWWTST